MSYDEALAEHWRRGATPQGLEEVDKRIKSPPHYTKSSIQPIDVIRAWDLDYCLGSTLKYLCRYKHKGTPVDDIKKAKRFLEMWLEDNDG
jgi:hypothetical protein